jgi:cytochrome P450
MMAPMPRVTDVDLMDPRVQEDWYPAYETLRRQAPVWRSPTGEYVLTRYKELQHVLRHPELFPNAVPGQNPLLNSPEALAVYQRDGWPRHSPLGTNPPEHRAYRSLVDGWFDKAGAARSRPMITDLCNRLIDDWIDEREVEFVSRFALPLPIMVITSLLGLPLEDIPQLKVWSEAWVMPFARGLTEAQERYVAEQGVQFQRYIHNHVEQKRRRPGDYVLSNLAHARLESPTQGLWRMVGADVELEAIPAGSVLHLRYAAANRDDAMFADADRLDLDRTNAARHLAFSAGEHKCPGADLSRVEQHVAFELLLSRLDHLRFTPAANDFTHMPGYVLRALKSLHISFGRG